MGRVPIPDERISLMSLAVVTICLAGLPRLHADVFELTNGGQLVGEWLNADQNPATSCKIRTDHGVDLELDRSDVKRAERESPEKREYRRVVTGYPDDVAGNWSAAQWCETHSLADIRRVHLRRILQLDPDHAKARRALGYSQVRGQWVTRAEFMRRQGYVHYRGKWVLSQTVDLKEAQRRRELAEREWFRKLSRWRGALGTEQAAQAEAAFSKIRDPMAVAPLVALLEQEALRPVKSLYISVLAGIGTPTALDALANVVLLNPDEELVHLCLDYLVAANDPRVYQRFLKTLNEESNVLINRAAVALGRLRGEATVDALIDALETHHTMIYVKADQRTLEILQLERRLNHGNRWDSKSFVSFGPVLEDDESYTLVHVLAHNRQVLAALSHLTGITGYSYDEKAWKRWRYFQVRRDGANDAASAELRRTR